MKIELAVVVVLVVAAVEVGCSSSSLRPPVAVGRPAIPEPSTTCPFGVRGARVNMSETEDGMVIALRGYGDVTELRRRARDAAAMYGPGAHRGLGHDGVHGRGDRHGLGLAHLGVPVLAEEQDTPEGARITVRPVLTADLDRMRKALREREERTRSGKCP
jgi:hypothetical protein